MDALKEFNAILEAQATTDQLIKAKRPFALDYVHKIIDVFGFTVEDLFTGTRAVFRNNALANCLELYFKDPTISRQDFIAEAEKIGINAGTAGTQHSRLKNSKEHNCFPTGGYPAFGYEPDQRVPTVCKFRLDNNVEDDLAELVLVVSKDRQDREKPYTIAINCLRQGLCEPYDSYATLAEARAAFVLQVDECKKSWAEKAKYRAAQAAKEAKKVKK